MYDDNFEADAEPRVEFECPYCGNYSSSPIDFIEADYGRVEIRCDGCRGKIFLEMVVPRRFKNRLSFENIRLEDE